MNATLWLLVTALIGNGLLVGASLDQSIKQLPTRHRMGVVAFSAYSQASFPGRSERRRVERRVPGTQDRCLTRMVARRLQWLVQ